MGGAVYFFTCTDLVTASSVSPPMVAFEPSPTATIKPWAGPPRPIPTATPLMLPPTPVPTNVLAESGFPAGFTPTPRPTREPVYILLPQLYPMGGSSVDAPEVNQVLYPEPFFAPGTNSACGPVALFAAAHALGVSPDYGRLRDIAVNNGFNASGISTWGMVNTIATLNNELGQPFTIEYNHHYHLSNLTGHLRQQGVAIVLVHVRKENGRYRLTTENAGSVGHFLLVESISVRSKKVKFAGSTLGMAEVSLQDFIRSWTNNPDATTGMNFSLKNDPSTGWALILKRASQEPSDFGQ